MKRRKKQVFPYIITTVEDRTMQSMSEEFARLAKSLKKSRHTEEDLRSIYYYTWDYWLVMFDKEYDLLKRLPYSEFLNTFYWKLVREAKILAAEFSCELCSKKTWQLDVHHKTYAHHGAEHRNLGDLSVLCHKCHTKQHKKETPKVLDKLFWAMGEK